MWLVCIPKSRKYNKNVHVYIGKIVSFNLISYLFAKEYSQIGLNMPICHYILSDYSQNYGAEFVGHYEHVRVGSRVATRPGLVIILPSMEK